MLLLIATSFFSLMRRESFSGTLKNSYPDHDRKSLRANLDRRLWRIPKVLPKVFDVVPYIFQKYRPPKSEINNRGHGS